MYKWVRRLSIYGDPFCGSTKPVKKVDKMIKSVYTHEVWKLSVNVGRVKHLLKTNFLKMVNATRSHPTPSTVADDEAWQQKSHSQQISSVSAKLYSVSFYFCVFTRGSEILPKRRQFYELMYCIIRQQPTYSYCKEDIQFQSSNNIHWLRKMFGGDIFGSHSSQWWTKLKNSFRLVFMCRVWWFSSINKDTSMLIHGIEWTK